MKNTLALVLVMFLLTACDFPFQVLETSLPDRTEATAGEMFVIPLYVSPLPEKEVEPANSFSIRLKFSDAVELIGVERGEVLPAENRMSLMVFSEKDGQLRVAYAGIEPITLDGELLRLHFRALESGASVISVEGMRFNEGQFTEVRTSIGGIYIN